MPTSLVIYADQITVDAATGDEFLLVLDDQRFRLTPSAALVLLSKLTRELIDTDQLITQEVAGD